MISPKNSVLIENILGIVRTLQLQEGLSIKRLSFALVSVLLLELHLI